MFRTIVFLTLIWAPATLLADTLFAQAASQYQLKPALLKSIAEMESQLHPWAVNLNWEGFKPRSKADAVALVKATQNKPWLLRLDYPDTSQRLFFRNRQDAAAALEQTKNNATLLGINRPSDWEIRKLDTRSVDIGLMQINWKFHGRHFDSLEQLFEPKTNVMYAAKYLHKLLRRHGSTERAVAFYHSNTQQYQAKYLSLFRPIYQKQLILARR
ncbi:MAG: transglycosylase SLT domain-containing protein [Ketobacter sp.]|nr:transglycosylase SLT domain-containing protein [Ketobacter sp.]